MIIVDDHLALLAAAGQELDLRATGPVATTSGFQFRLARAVADSARSGSLSQSVVDPTAALNRVLAPPAHRLLVLDPRTSMRQSVEIAVRHRTNLLLAELAGAAVSHRAAVRVMRGNLGKTWPDVMRANDIDFDVIDA